MLKLMVYIMNLNFSRSPLNLFSSSGKQSNLQNIQKYEIHFGSDGDPRIILHNGKFPIKTIFNWHIMIKQYI